MVSIPVCQSGDVSSILIFCSRGFPEASLNPLRDYKNIRNSFMDYSFSGLENRISAEHLKAGEVVKVTGIGNSMTPILKSRQPVICIPVTKDTILSKRDIVLCKVNGHYYLHLIWSLKPGDRFLIGNNHNHPNGVISRNNIYGKVVEIL